MKKLKKGKLEDIHIRTLDFVNSLSEKDKILVMHHTDGDGVISAALLSVFLQRSNLPFSLMAVENDEYKKEKIMEAKSFEKIFLLDIPADDIGDIISKLNKEVLIIDHHTIGKDLNSSKVIYYNPRLDHPEIYQPASYLVYKIFSRLVKLRDKEWLAVVGTIGDFGYKDCLDLVEKYVKVKKDFDIWKTKFGKVAKIIQAAISILGTEKVLKILIESESLSSAIKNSEVKNSAKMFYKEFKTKRREFLKHKEKIGKAFFGIIERPKFHRLASELSSQLSIEYPNNVIIILHESKNNIYKISARFQKGSIHLGLLFRKLGIGGGHRPAAGGYIKTNELEKFKDQLKRSL